MGRSEGGRVFWGFEGVGGVGGIYIPHLHVYLYVHISIIHLPCVGVKTREEAMPLVAPEEPPIPLTALSAAACCFLVAGG